MFERHMTAHDLHPMRLDLPRVEWQAGGGRDGGAAKGQELASGQHEVTGASRTALGEMVFCSSMAGVITAKMECVSSATGKR
jgi:hypothetical protein